MSVRAFVDVALVFAVVALLPATQAMAQVDTAQELKKAGIVDIPLELSDIDMTNAATTLWVRGDQPANMVIAHLTARPVQAARLVPAEAGSASADKEPLLWRAVPGGSGSSGRERLSRGWKTFCGKQGTPKLLCWIDQDGDGAFDHQASAIPERGTQPYHVTIIRALQPLEAPRPYTIVPDAERPAVPIEIRNCDKDHDRPRFAAVSTVDRSVPVDLGAWHDKNSSFAACRAGTRAPASAGLKPQVPDGGFLAEIGPLLFAVGPKKDPTLALVGPVDAEALYRIESASLVNLSVGPTPSQAQLLARQQFPYPALMTKEGATIREGKLLVGDEIASVPFRHAYSGKLTKDVSISTLLSKRAVPAGTIVYGFPGRPTVRISYGAYGTISQQRYESEFRDASMQLTWCAPIQAPEQTQAGEGSAGQNGWSAACIPYSPLGNHTIIADLQPAFAVERIAYNVATSSNDGEPPIVRTDREDFPQPLRLVYSFEGLDGEAIRLREKIYHGDVLTSSSPRTVYTQGKTASVGIAGAQLRMAVDGSGALTVTAMGAPAVGTDPSMVIDQTEMIRAALSRAGLKLVQPGSDAEPADVPR